MKDDKADRFRLYDRQNEKGKDVPQRQSLLLILCIAHSSKPVWRALFGDHILNIIKSGEVLIKKEKRLLKNKYSKWSRLNKPFVRPPGVPVGSVKILVGSKILCWLAFKNSYLLSCVAGGMFYTTIDLAHGYWQGVVKKLSWPKTAFASLSSLF